MRLLLSIAVAASCGCSTPAIAQEDLTVEELSRLFQRQKEAFSEANSNGLGETRGLKLVTIGEEKPSEGAATVTAETGETATDPNKPLQVASDANAPVVFGQLDPDLQVNLRIEFAFDSASLSDSEKPKLAKMCEVLQQTDINLVRIVGHTDTSGSAAYNERLSRLRAEEVARHLTGDCGIAASRLETIGMGERFPSNTVDGRADENRRVEFQALS